MKNKKSLGQNWLKDRSILEAIADLATKHSQNTPNLSLPKLCVEIGPGLGTLTSSLLKRFEKVLALEFDSNLAKNLPKSFPGKNLDVRNIDVLNFDFDYEINEPFVITGNIPYYITSKIIKKILTLNQKPEKIVLLVQKEVAEKICNKTRSSSLSLFVENFALASLGPVVKRELFTPPPKVDSRILILEPKPTPETSPDENLLNFIQLCFSTPRKKLVKSPVFSHFSQKELQELFSSINFSTNARPADLSFQDYQKLAKSLKNI